MNNLDKILQQQMENFAPDAPNVWAGIQQGLNASAAAPAAKVVKGTKLISVLAKIAAIAAIPVGLTTYYFTQNTAIVNKQAEVVTNQAPLNELPQKEIIISQAEIAENKLTKTSQRKQSTKVFNLPKVENVVIVKTESQPVRLGKNEANQINSVMPINQPVLDKELEQEFLENESTNLEENSQIPVQSFDNEIITNTLLKKLPNVFSPNGDGINDKYLVEIENERNYNLKIFNQNNELVFESSDKNTLWDGTCQKNGQVCGSGIYYGILNYKANNEEKVKTIMTRIKLVR